MSGVCEALGLPGKATAAGHAEPLNFWYHQIEIMRATIQKAAIGPLAIPDEGYVIGRAEIVLRRGSDAVRVITRPATLLGGLWMQLGQHLAGRAALMSCDHCGGWFAAGGPGRPPTDCAVLFEQLQKHLAQRPQDRDHRCVGFSVYFPYVPAGNPRRCLSL
jgi:hypothetical protein